jgi:hypothetical protein
MSKDIVKPNGEVYMTVDSEGSFVQFKNFGPNKLTINFDVKALEQLIPALQEIYFYDWCINRNG